MKLVSAFLVLLALVAVPVSMVKLEDFKTCDKSGFCTRHRAYVELKKEQPSFAGVSFVKDSLKFDGKNSIKFGLVNSAGSSLSAAITLYKEGIVRVTIDEVGNEKYKRRKVANVLVNDDESYLELIESYSHKSVQSDLFEVDAKEYALIIDFRSEFVIKVLNGVNGDVVGLLNGNGWLKYETSTVDEKFPDDLSDDLKQRLNKDKGEESFKGHHDKKPYGPTAIGVDYSFFGVESVYGLAEHSDGLELKETLGDSKKYQDPYRLYNLDVFEFELDTNTALYGSVPLILGHRISESGGSWTSGFFWLNTAETWVDVQKFTHASKKHGLFFQSSNDEPESSALKSTVTHWISEAGLFDCFILVGGSKPSNVLQQYAKLTGSTALPQLFALGYHQCRWNYNDQADVNSVVEKFEQHDIPFDVLWLDIEHTDGKRYFTWDYKKFSSPEKMIDRLASLGRKVVTIIDPHIKKDPGYSVYSKAKDLNLFTSTHVAEGFPFSEYEGWCWPGASAYLDFLNPEARKYWMQQFSDYKGSTLNLFTWNDMNEPSVFNGPEITMPKDNLHFQRTEHREVHNIYGLLQHRSTYAGHIYRSLPNRPSTGDSVVSVTSFTNRSSLLDGPLPHRPFVLSRAFFSGTQRFGAIWTGDNMAKWEHLESTIPMLLGVSLSGIGFCGADIGGFFFDPSSELLVRWYQSGLFYPFFRAHAHIDTKRREPWLFGEENMKLIKSAIQLRYKLLWVYYTLFRRAQVTGELSIIRPVWYEFPNQGSFLSEADSFMVGSSLYVKPIVKPLEKSSSIKFELPSGEIWYNFYSFASYPGGAYEFTNLQLSSPVPFFLRGGHILPLKNRERRSSLVMREDPFCLLVGLNKEGQASGEVYVDDGESFEYVLKGKFVHKSIHVKAEKGSILISSKDSPLTETSTKTWMKPYMTEFYDWSSAYDQMTFKPSYIEGAYPRVETITIVDGHGIFDDFKDITKLKLKVKGVAVKNPQDWISFKKVTESNVFGQESGYKSSSVLTVKTPPQVDGIENDFVINISI